MRFNLGFVLVAFLIGGCSGGGGHPAGGSTDTGGAGGGDEGTGGAPIGGRTGTGGATGGAGPTTGGSGGSGGSATGGAPGTGGGTGGSSETEVDAAAPQKDAGATPTDGPAKPPVDPGSINLAGPIPTPWDGPPVGPEVMMDCPGDPTMGFTEYKDTFKVEHPYDLPVGDRFSIDGGVFTFFVKQGDKRHSPTSTATNPRTEASWSQRFRTGVRMFSADVFWEKSVTNGTVVMQVHTTSTGIGPVYLVANGANVAPITGSKVPGGLFDRWINLKVLINADTTASQYWVNNCMVASKGSGTRGDGNDYFKIGVYHCDSGTCRAKVKNIHLYMK
jgi:hypothetical protein